MCAEVLREGKQHHGVVEGHIFGRHTLPEARHLGLVSALFAVAELDVGPEAPLLDVDGFAGIGIVTDRAVALGGLRHHLERALEGQLVGRQVVGDRRPLIGIPDLDVRAIPTDPHRDPFALGRLADGDPRSLTGFDLLTGGDQGVEPHAHDLEALVVVFGEAEVKIMQPRCGLCIAAGDGIECVLHAGGEVVVDQVGQVALEQSDDGKGGEGRHQRLPLVPHIAAVLDGLDDRGVGRGTSDAPRLELLDQTGLGVARRRLRGVAGRLEVFHCKLLARAERGQDLFLVVLLGPGVVRARDIGAVETGESDDLARGGEGRCSLLLGGRLDPNPGADSLGVHHLRGEGALPYQLVELHLVAIELRRQFVRCAEPSASRADRLVRFLRALGLRAINAGLVGQILGTIEFFHLATGGTQGLARKRQRVGAHIGDVTVLIQALCDPHGAAGIEA